MIIWIFLIWLILAIVLLFLGFWADDQIIQTIAFGILWIPAFALSGISIPMLYDNPGIQFPDGYNTTSVFNETYMYGNNFTGYHWDYTGTEPTYSNPQDLPAYLFHRWRTEDVSKTINYSSYQNRLYGILLLFVAVFGMVLSVGGMRGVNDYEGPQRINWRRFWE